MVHVARRETSLSHISSRAGQIVDSIDIEELPRILRRRLWLIVSIMAASVIAAATILYVLPSRYTSEIAILVGGEAGTVFNLQVALANQPADEAWILSQLTVVQSRKLAERVIDALGLDRDREFNKSLRSASVFDSVVQRTAEFLHVPAATAEPDEVLVRQRRRIPRAPGGLQPSAFADRRREIYVYATGHGGERPERARRAIRAVGTGGQVRKRAQVHRLAREPCTEAA